MRHFALLLSFMFVSSTSFGQFSEEEIRDYVDHFLVAIGTQIPDVTGGMASALGAVPGTVRIAITKRCHVKMQSIEMELQDNNYSPERFLELNELYIRAQAINSAINGDSKPLIDFEKNKKKRMKEREEERKRKEKERKKKLREEEKESMVIMLDIYQDEINKLTASIDELINKGQSNSQSAEFKLQRVKQYLDEYHENGKFNDNIKTIYSIFAEEGKIFCDEAHKSQDRINELYKVLIEGEELINSRIDQAKGRAANCTKNEDALFVIEKYKEAKQAFAILKKGKEGAFEKLVNIKVNLTKIDKINKSIDSLNSYTINNTPKGQWKNNKNDINTLLEEVVKNLDQLELGFSKEKVLNSKLDALKRKINDSRQYYAPIFPKYEPKYNMLIDKISRIYIEYDYHVISLVGLSDLRQRYNQYEQAYSLLLASSNSRKQTIKYVPLIKCLSIKKAQKKMDQIEEIYFRSLLVIKSNEQFSVGCTPVVPKSTQDNPDEKEVSTDNTIKPPSNRSDTEEYIKPEKTTFGGLIIGGPSQITVGSGSQFIALDGGGNPYPNQGGFTWTNTRQDLMVLSSSGDGKAFRAGRATIILKFDGMTAYKDIEIKAKKVKGNKVPLTEGERDRENQLKEKCYDLI